jgi:hypothetical protein
MKEISKYIPSQAITNTSQLTSLNELVKIVKLSLLTIKQNEELKQEMVEFSPTQLLVQRLKNDMRNIKKFSHKNKPIDVEIL